MLAIGRVSGSSPEGGAGKEKPTVMLAFFVLQLWQNRKQKTTR
jgi:hypothetical protein